MKKLIIIFVFVFFLITNTNANINNKEKEIKKKLKKCILLEETMKIVTCQYNLFVKIFPSLTKKELCFIND